MRGHVTDELARLPAEQEAEHTRLAAELAADREQFEAEAERRKGRGAGRARGPRRRCAGPGRRAAGRRRRPRRLDRAGDGRAARQRRGRGRGHHAASSTTSWPSTPAASASRPQLALTTTAHRNQALVSEADGGRRGPAGPGAGRPRRRRAGRRQHPPAGRGGGRPAARPRPQARPQAQVERAERRLAEAEAGAKLIRERTAADLEKLQRETYEKSARIPRRGGHPAQPGARRTPTPSAPRHAP